MVEAGSEGILKVFEVRAKLDQRVQGKMSFFAKAG